MALPDDTTSSAAVSSPLMEPDNTVRTDLRVDLELGGTAIGDPSQGMQVQVWRAWSDGVDIWCAPDGTLTPVTHVLTGTSITELSLCFDQNMRPTIAYVDSGLTKLYWYDTSVAAPVTTTYPGVRSPMVCLDDKRAIASFNGWNDDLFFYIRDDFVYYRQQRDRFLIERPFGADSVPPSSRIYNMGMGVNNRIQVRLAAGIGVAYTSLVDDTLYVVDSFAVVPLFGGADNATAVWRSKVFVTDAQPSFGWARVEGDYPATMRVYGDGVLSYELTGIASNDPFRLPPVRGREWQIEVESDGNIVAVEMADALSELTG